MPDAPVTAAQFKEAQAAEWSTYVAVADIDINGARAFNVGHPVHVDHVKNGVVREDQVAKVSTKAGQAAVAAVLAPEQG